MWDTRNRSYFAPLLREAASPLLVSTFILAGQAYVLLSIRLRKRDGLLIGKLCTHVAIHCKSCGWIPQCERTYEMHRYQNRFVRDMFTAFESETFSQWCRAQSGLQERQISVAVIMIVGEPKRKERLPMACLMLRSLALWRNACVRLCHLANFFLSAIFTRSRQFEIGDGCLYMEY